MSNQDDKLQQILAILERSKMAIPLATIQEELQAPVSNRTLRRWLHLLIEQGKVEITGQHRSTKYQLVAGISAGETQAHPFFTDTSMKLLDSVAGPIYTRQPCSYQESFLLQYRPNHDYYLSASIRKQLAKSSAGVLKQLEASTYTQAIFNRLLIDLSYNSSKLEGNTYSLLETEKLVLQGKAADDKLDMEKIMILNHKEAIKLLVEGINRIELNIQTVYSMHYLLAYDLVDQSNLAEVRDDMVRITASTYLPLVGKEKLTALLAKIINKADKIEDPFEQSFFVLCHLSYLQAFIDVNKRTARLCANIPLIKNHLVPLAFNDINKDEYLLATIVFYELNDPRPLAELYSWSYQRTCLHYKTTAQALGFDPIRVSHRPLRRQLINKIIEENLVGKKLAQFIQENAKQLPQAEQSQFIKDLTEELNALSNHKIGGLGISQQQFDNWYKKFKLNS